MIFKKTLLLFLSALTALVVLECVAYFYLKRHHQQSKFLYSSKVEVRNNDDKVKLYRKIDPLLGWAIDSDEIIKNNYNETYNSILLESKLDNQSDTFVIYISGGSTSDLIYDQNNWPFFLLQELEKNKINSRIYVASVGGYNTGQELLKTIRDIDLIKPDIHISYSGANEMEDPSYVSFYEFEIFNNFTKNKEYKYLPNVLKIGSLILGNQKPQIEIVDRNNIDGVYFWKQNLTIMKSIADMKDYSFIGVLQPVKGQDSSLKEFEKIDKETQHLINDYEAFYPKAKEMASQSEYIFDFTNIFKNQKEDVFKDDCHLNSSKYQKILSHQIYNLLDSLIIQKHITSNEFK